ncbi:solute carrier family 12 member 2-like [Tubulanus polymorphus]|uniref:solute carrier family 12 member 2-like n=1 Tax=Tubulanus polymorphus TaxID=672921 RepID=UPI003DA31096
MKSRPTLAQLHEEKVLVKSCSALDGILLTEENGTARKESNASESIAVKKKDKSAPKFGWIQGVLIRCLLNIWGVMLFIRLSWVVGQAGIGLTTLIILISAVVTTITSLSMSAICTNGEVKGGGAYYMISRSLGPEFGGAIGLIFSLANAVAVAMYVVGFAETVRDLMVAHNAVMVDPTNDVRIIGILTMILIVLIAVVGMEWEARAQIGLLVILIIAIINFIVGAFIPPTTEKAAKGFTGPQGYVFMDNMGPDFRDGESFFSVFSIFFPAATGILAGANISGDLNDAQKAIPKGTLLAILLSTIVYLFMAWLCGSIVVRDAIGPVAVAAANATISLNSTDATPPVVSSNQTQCLPGQCQYGLMNNMQVMEMVSGFGPLITAGIFSATLSSALASLIGAPKVFQAVCKDRIFPKIHVFAKGYGKSGEPFRAYMLTFGIALGFIAIGELNAIAPIISNFFLMAYALINYSCFDASLAKSPGWRPAFKYYSMWISLLGAGLCLGVMFVINWWCALITFVIVAGFYVYIHYTKPDVNWGSSTQAHMYRNALQTSLKLMSVLDHVKNFRPQILVLSGYPGSRPALVDFANNITKNLSLLVVGDIISQKTWLDVALWHEKHENQVSSKELHEIIQQAYRWLHSRKIKGFYNAITSNNFEIGARSLLQTTGMGKLRPNTLLMGFKSNWLKVKPQEVLEYFTVVHEAFDMNYGVGILRVCEGFDCSDHHIEIEVDDSGEESSAEEQEANATESSKEHSLTKSTKTEESIPLSPLKSTESVENSEDEIDSKDNREEELAMSDVGTIESEASTKKSVRRKSIKIAQINQDVLRTVNMFHRKQKKGTIDVWWLFDDGGLTLLLPYILSTKSHWRSCKLRVFTAGKKMGELDHDQRNMAALLSKFRIEYSSMTVIPDIGRKPKSESKEEFDLMLSDWLAKDNKDPESWQITQSELVMHKEKTNRHIRLRELLKEHSSEASLIVMTLPIPRKGTTPAGLYMAWLDILTKDMPPILLLRGNQTSVLTYYS